VESTTTSIVPTTTTTTAPKPTSYEVSLIDPAGPKYKATASVRRVLVLDNPAKQVDLSCPVQSLPKAGETFAEIEFALEVEYSGRPVVSATASLVLPGENLRNGIYYGQIPEEKRLNSVRDSYTPPFLPEGVPYVLVEQSSLLDSKCLPTGWERSTTRVPPPFISQSSGRTATGDKGNVSSSGTIGRSALVIRFPAGMDASVLRLQLATFPSADRAFVVGAIPIRSDSNGIQPMPEIDRANG
jgi:hypothetical protein